MYDFCINLSRKPQMFPDCYINEINNAFIRTRDIVGIDKLHHRIDDLYKRIYDCEVNKQIHPGALYVELDTLLFELKAIGFLISENPKNNLVYEPNGNYRNGKTIDFTFAEESKQFMIEFKATNPKTKELRIPKEHFSADTLEANPMYYNWISSVRSHLIDFLVDTEDKNSNYSGEYISVLCVYGNFYIEGDEVRYLWHYYITGEPFEGDAFGEMMKHEVKKKSIKFDGTIDELWVLSFPQYGFELEENGFLRLSR